MTDAEIKAYKFDRFKVDKLPSGWAVMGIAGRHEKQVASGFPTREAAFGEMGRLMALANGGAK